MDKLIFKKIGIEDKELFNIFFKKYQPEISELTFTNLFIWQKYREIEYALYENGLIILATIHGKKFFFEPVGFPNPEKIILELFEYSKKNNITDSFKRVSEKTVKQLTDLSLKIEEDRNSFDYLYKTEDLAFLKGRNYSSKRNFITKFFAEYSHRYWKFTNAPDCRKKCIELTEKWFEKRHDTDPTLKYEYDAIMLMFEYFDKLDSIGSVICVDEKIAAYTFGEKLNKNTFVVHFEKALHHYTGIYQTINKLFAENELLGNYEFINREQDLGIEGLRKSKSSYLPVNLIKKYNITI